MKKEQGTTKEEDPLVNETENYSDYFTRATSLVIILIVMMADYLGFKSQYSSFILGGAATIYIFGRKGFIVLISKYSGRTLEEIDDFFKK